MKLIGSALSPYALRVILAARAKGLDLPIEEPAGGTRTPQYLALNPIGKVPVLVDGTVAIPESDVILSYLEDRFPNPSLLPGNADERANARLLVRLIDTYCVPSFGPFIQNDKAAIATALERIDSSLGYIEHFRRDGRFASGDTLSIADCALIPFFVPMDLLQAAFGTIDLVKKRPKLAAWWTRSRETDLGQFAAKEMTAAVQRLSQQR